MSLRLAVSPAVVTTAAALLFDAAGGWPLQTKRVHVLEADDEAPDGLSVAYRQHAAALNIAARGGRAQGLAAGLAAEIEAELDRAVVLEARLLALLGAAR